MTSAVPSLVLASASPRRSALLTQLGLVHRVMPSQIDERRLEGEPIERCVCRLATQKAQHVTALLAAASASAAAGAGAGAHEDGDGTPASPETAVLGADTTVVIDAQMLGKPRDRAHGLAMLAQLSGREHEVLTAVTLIYAGTVYAALSRSLVRLRVLGQHECEAYWDTREPQDKAGCYAIQGRGAVFVEALHGSYSGVMGLPLFETAGLLAAAGLPVWHI